MARRAKRVYDNSRRTELAEASRIRILEAVGVLSSEHTDFSTAAIAKRAGVSEPTIYRYFANREALLVAANEYWSRRLGAPPPTPSLEEFPQAAIVAALYFGRNAAWMRAATRSPEFREMRMTGRRRRVAEFRTLLEPALAHLEPRERDIAFAAFSSIQRSETWDYATSELGLTDEEAGQAVSFAVSAMLERLARLKKAGKTTAVEPEIVKRARAANAEHAAASAPPPPPR